MKPISSHLPAAILWCVALLVSSHSQGYPQGRAMWLNVGSLHNWYSEFGWEIEEGFVLRQQYGLRWPAQYQWQDMQAAKSMWIGTTNFTDTGGTVYPHKVVHLGPRVSGLGEFFPQEFTMYAAFERPVVTVNGSTIYPGEDPPTVTDTLKADRCLVSVSHTAIGLTVTRKIYAFSQRYHSNYHVFEITYTNTGNIDDDADIEFPARTLTGVQVFFMFRYSINQEIRYMVSNSSGWGINTMNDSRGFPPDTANSLIASSQNDVKCNFAWHGLHSWASKPAPGSSPNASTFDNIGAPIFDPGLSAGYIQAADTNWRLGAAQFVGHAHVYAPISATNPTPALDQPSTSNYYGSDEPLTRNNSQFDPVMMEQEYALMTQGHREPRHAWRVQPDGNFSAQSQMGNVDEGEPGGFSSGWGYGPYTLGPGQSFTVVFAEGADGLTREEAERIGLRYKLGEITTEAKNDSVLSGLDRLLQTFRRAKENYAFGYTIPLPPRPPASFTVTPVELAISLAWAPDPLEGAYGFLGYRIYRKASGSLADYEVIYQCGGTDPNNPEIAYVSGVEYSYVDTTAAPGEGYVYYITSFGDPSANNGAGLTPAGSLESSLFYTQSVNPAYVLGPSSVKDGDGMPKSSALRQNYPNPFNPLTTIPYELSERSHVSLRVYNALGQQVAVLVDEVQPAGYRSVGFDASDLPSGVYFCRLQAGEFVATSKLLLVR